MVLGPEPQRVWAAIERAREAVAPTVQRELERAYGSAWLEQANAERTARGHPAARGLHDHRFVLSLVAHEPALAQMFDEEQRAAARQLNGIGNTLFHNEPLRAGDAPRSEQLARRVIGRAEARGAAEGRRSARSEREEEEPKGPQSPVPPAPAPPPPVAPAPPPPPPPGCRAGAPGRKAVAPQALPAYPFAVEGTAVNDAPPVIAVAGRGPRTDTAGARATPGCPHPDTPGAAPRRSRLRRAC